MAFPNDGYVKIWPDNVSIVQGRFSLANDAAPQIVRSAANLDAYYDLRVPNNATAPCLTRDDEYAATGIYVPFPGTYELQFSPSSLGLTFYDGSYPSAPVATLDFLDADFPTGMRLHGAFLAYAGLTRFGASHDVNITSINFKYFGSTIDTLAPASPVSYASYLTPIGAIIPNNGVTRWSIVQLMKTFGLTVNVSAAVAGAATLPQSIISDFGLVAQYNTSAIQWTTNTAEALPGDIADLESPTNSLGNFDPEQFKIYWDTLPGEEDVNPLFPGWTGGVVIPTQNILTLTNGYFRFIMPKRVDGVLLPYGGRRLMLTGTGVNISFVGEFPLQNYNITLVDGSGLYQLVDGKRNDTYYDRSVSPVVTTDLKIPNPRAKTGYFNG